MIVKRVAGAIGAELQAVNLGDGLDAESRLLWRFPPRRVEAEVIRDSILTVSGQLNAQRFGQGFDFFRQKGGLADFIPHKKDSLDMSRDNTPLFDLHSLEDQIATALERKVPLKSGGYLVFDQTEAMSTIDVNTGAYVGHRNLEHLGELALGNRGLGHEENGFQRRPRLHAQLHSLVRFTGSASLR